MKNLLIINDPIHLADHLMNNLEKIPRFLESNHTFPSTWIFYSRHFLLTTLL